MYFCIILLSNQYRVGAKSVAYTCSDAALEAGKQQHSSQGFGKQLCFYSISPHLSFNSVHISQISLLVFPSFSLYLSISSFSIFFSWYLRELSFLSLSIEEWWATLVYIELCVFMCVSTFRVLLKTSPSILRTTARAEFGSEHSLLILSWTHSLFLSHVMSLSSSKPRSTKDHAFRQTSCLELKLVIKFGSK